jgi:hypothetical protein
LTRPHNFVNISIPKYRIRGAGQLPPAGAVLDLRSAPGRGLLFYYAYKAISHSQFGVI